MLLGSRNGFAGVSGAKLPYDAEVEYLESTGTQWIDTLYNAHSGASVQLKFRFLDGMVGKDKYIFAIDNTYRLYLGTYQSKWQFGYGGYYQAEGISDNVDYEVQADFIQGADKLIVNGNTLINRSDDNNITTSLNWRIFSRSNNATWNSRARLYWLKLYDNGVLVRDYVPVRFTNELGQSEGAMYDRVSGQLFRNQGTGVFLYGGDVYSVPIETSQYVQDGLVAMWDGKENAGVGKRCDTATSWKDLVGTRDATLSGTYSWGSNYWHRDNSTSTNAVLPNIPIGAGFMIEYCSVLHNAGDTNFRDFSKSSGSRFEILQSSNSQLSTFYINYNGSSVQRGWKVGIGTSRVAKTIAVGFDSLGAVYSINGGTLGYDRTVNTPISSSYGNVGLNVGKYGTPSEDADYFSIRIYNKILTDVEIAANYAVDKQRFNLP